MKFVLLGLIGALLVLMLYVRFAPLNGEKWHKAALPEGAAGAFTSKGSHTVLRDVEDAQASLRALDAIIMSTPRTVRIAGSVEDGRITYVTRSLGFGFPDYTTAVAQPAQGTSGMIAIHGRLRFGKSDLGVNRARISGWLAQLDGAQS